MSDREAELQAHIASLQKAGLDALQCIRDHKWEEGEDPRLADLAHTISSTPAESLERLRALDGGRHVANTIDDARRPDSAPPAGVHSTRYGSRLDPDVVFVRERQQRDGNLS